MAKNVQNHHHKQADQNKLNQAKHIGHARHQEQVEKGLCDDNNHPETHDHHVHQSDHGQHHQGNFKEIFLKSLPLGIVILLMSPMMEIQLPFQFTFSYSDIVAAVLATILLIYGGKPFYQGAIAEFKQKKPGMMALISLGLSVSYFYSIYAVSARYATGEHVMDYFFEFASLLLIMLLGHWIEMKAVGDAGDAQRSLAELVPKDAHVVLDDDSIDTRPVAELKVGNIVRVQAGENIPADGIIKRGTSRINEALLTGESKPVEKEVGDKVIGGSTNGEGVLYLEVQETGSQSFISQVQALIGQAQEQPSRAENLAQKVAGWLFYIAIAAAVIAFVIWLYIADIQTAILFYGYDVSHRLSACSRPRHSFSDCAKHQFGCKPRTAGERPGSVGTGKQGRCNDTGQNRYIDHWRI